MLLECTENFYEIYSVYKLNKYRIIVPWGGSRSGKTYAILQILILIAIKNKNKKITVWRKTKVVCKETVMDDFKQILMSDATLSSLFLENKTQSSFLCKITGSRIIFRGADEESKVVGGSQDVAYFNEINDFNKDVYKHISQRTADTIFADYNPSESFWFESFKHRSNAIFIHSTYRKNSKCPIEIVKQLNSYRPINEKLIGKKNAEVLKSITDAKKAYEFISSIVDNSQHIKELLIGWHNHKEGTVDEYSFKVYCEGIEAEKPNKVYKGWKKISEQDYIDLPYEEFDGLDFGTAAPTAMVGVKFDGDRTFYIRKKIYEPAKDKGGILKLVNKQVKLGRINKYDEIIVADPAKNEYIILLRRDGFNIVKAKKGSDSISTGIGIVQSFNIYYVYDKDLYEEYSTYSYRIDRYGKPTDEPIKKNDHLMDAIRYAITFLVNYLNIKIK